MNSPMYFEIQSANPAKLVTFYSTVFGWNCTKDDSIPIEYWRIETEGINGGILKEPAPKANPTAGTNAFTCSMQIEDFDATAHIIKENGGKIAMEKFAVPGKCWQGYFQDPEGNTFGLFQVDKNAK